MEDKPMEFLTWREMADEIGVHPLTIGRYMDRGELEYYFIGNRRKVARWQWRHFLESRRASGPLVDPEEDDA